MIAGANYQRSSEGVYHLTTTNFNGSSVYKQAGGKNYLYYWAPFKAWLVGHSYLKSDAGIHGFGESGSCPSHTNKWQQYHDNALKVLTGVGVSCSTFPFRPPVCVLMWHMHTYTYTHTYTY